MYHESKLVWWNAQECQLQICELISSTNPGIGPPNLPHSGVWHALLCQTDLAAQIWPCLSSKPVVLLRCRQVIVDFERSGTVVWFSVASRFSWFDTSRKRLLGLHNEKHRAAVLNLEPVNSRLASTPFPEGKSRPQTVPSHSPIARLVRTLI